MCENVLNQHELERMTKQELISKIIRVQNHNQHLANQCRALQPGKPKKKRRKKEKEIDFKECNYRRIALKMAYFGWDYRGLQSNPNVDDTIEAMLRRAIRQARLAAEDDPLKFSRSGRTDKGVSAFQQVVTTRVRTKLSSGLGVTKWIDPSAMPIDDRQAEHIYDVSMGCESAESLLSPDKKDVTLSTALNDVTEITADDSDYDFVIMINRNLPPEIRILSWFPVQDESFSARHNCLGREYRYFFPRGNLDVNAMKKASKLFCGLHDFRNFGKINGDKPTTLLRRIDEFEIVVNDSSVDPFHMCYAQVKGSGFLYHQVRNMMAVLYLIGAGLEEENVITTLLDVEANERKPSYVLADAEPLVLYKTYYGGIRWRVSREAMNLLTRHLYRYWHESAVRSKMSFELLSLFESDRARSVSLDSGEKEGDVDDATPDPRHPVHSHLKMSGFSKRSRKSYRKIMDLPKGKTVEEKIEDYNAKRRRLGCNDADVTCNQPVTLT